MSQRGGYNSGRRDRAHYAYRNPPPSNGVAGTKRDAILISSDNEEEGSSAPKISRTNNQPSFSSQSSTRDSFGAGPYHGAHVTHAPQLSQQSSSQGALNEDEDEYGADDLVMWSQDDGNSYDTFERYGTLSTKIVGVRYYKGHATNGEHVLVRREPSNPYDSNAIRVDNIQRDQIGHIPRQMAAKLSSYMDDGSLLLEAHLSGNRGEYDCPLTIALYGTSDPYQKEHLRVRMQKDKLPLDKLKERERAEKQRKIQELAKVAKKGAALGKSSQQQWTNGINAGQAAKDPAPDPGPTLDELAGGSERFNPRALKEVVEDYGAGEAVLKDMPMADQPKRLVTQLLPYQRQGLAWLLDREGPKLPAQGSKDAVQLWKRSSTNKKLFTNIATNFSQENPKLASGGILADDMGLGKTIQMISLIVADTALSSDPQDGSNSTLIIAPLSIMSNWSGQMAFHVTKENPLRVLIYHEATKKKLTKGDFAQYDVVITTYGTLSSEYLPSKNSKPKPIPRADGLYSTNWRRIILDEGHNIRNPATKSALAATAIMATSHWALTGTPIINSLKDLYSIVRFIGLTGGLQSLEIFNSVLIRPLKNGDDAATLLLQALMATICLRRRKDMSFVDLKLPALNEYIHRITFKDHEREKYNALQDEAKGVLQKYHANRGNNAAETYRHLLEVLLRLRQVCNHWKLCGERISKLMGILDEQKTVELTPENRKALQDMLQLSIESREDCPVCLDDLTGHSPVISHCGHIFGRDCIVRVIETQHKCPMCRAELPDEGILVEPAREMGVGGSQEEEVEDDGFGPSSKVEALLNILKAAHKKQGTKIVVFSQWCRFLDLVQPHLDEGGYKYVRLDGSMKAAARDESLRALEQDPQTTILLASLGVASVGLNLTAANQVVLCDTWWAPAIEDQAVDRIHRLGQQRDCTVWRLVMEESIEERTLDIQADKRKLMSQAFQEKDKKKGSQARMGDIQRVLA